MQIHYYTKLYELIEQHPSVITIVQRFGILPGYGNRSIKECCDRVGAEYNTVLEILNIHLNNQYFPSRVNQRVTLSAVVDYVNSGYQYLVESQLYNLEKHLTPLLQNPNLRSISVPFANFKEKIATTIEEEQNEEFPLLIQKCKEFEDLSLNYDILLEPTKNSFSNRAAEMIADIKRAMLIHAGEGMNINLFHAVIFALTNLERDITHLSLVKERLLYPISQYIDKIIEEKRSVATNLDNILTKREEDVLRLIACGKQNKEIATILSISTNTVLSHRKNIISKLDIRTVSALTYYALVNKIVSESEMQNS